MVSTGWTRRARRLRLALLIAAGIAAAQADPRQVPGPNSPPWLAAVTRLVVPGEKWINKQRTRHQEHCSAVLVERESAASAERPLLLSAWHCLEHYHNLALPIEVLVTLPDGETLRAEARVIDQGQDMRSDWALLQLTQRAPQLARLGLPLRWQHPPHGTGIIMAGYSRDAGVGQNGAVLSFDDRCKITGSVAPHVQSNCMAHRGASGGAVIQVDDSGQAWLIGIISQGDGNERSFHTPLSDLHAAFKQLR